MESDVLVAVITSSVALITGIFGAGSFWSYLKERTRRKEAEDKGRKVEQGFVKAGQEGELLARETAYSIERHVVLIEFGDDGVGKITKRWVNLKVRKPVQNLTIPFETGIACPGGELLETEASEAEGSDIPVNLAADVMRSQDRMEGSLELVGYLTPESNPLTFEIRHTFRKGYCLTREEVDTAYRQSKWKTEYASGRITATAEVLEIEVKLPPSHSNVRPTAVAFIGDENVLTDVSEGLKNALLFRDGVARLLVPHPSLGVEYAIAWMPPSSKNSGGRAAVTT